MAPADCTLDEQRLTEQLDRYRRLSTSVLDVNREETAARVWFDPEVDRELLEQALAIERGCCSFFVVDYDTSERVLSVTTEPDRADALSTLLTVLAPSASDR
jgi:hypothetical protein